MSRKSHRSFAWIALFLPFLATAQNEAATTAVYWASGVYPSRAGTKSETVAWIENRAGIATREIPTAALKDFLSIRAEAAKLRASSVWILQSSRGTDSAIVTAALLATDDGRTLAEGAFPGDDFGQFRDEFGAWLPRAVAALAGLPTTFSTLAQTLAEAGRCADVARFAAETGATAACKAGKAKTATLSEPIRLAFRGVSATVKSVWIEEVDGSPLIRDAQQILTEPAELRLECLDACKTGTVTLTIFTTPEFLANEDHPLPRLAAFAGKLLEYAEASARRSKLPLQPTQLILQSGSGFTMNLKVEGRAGAARLNPPQSIRSFIDRN